MRAQKKDVCHWLGSFFNAHQQICRNMLEVLNSVAISKFSIMLSDLIYHTNVYESILKDYMRF